MTRLFQFFSVAILGVGILMTPYHKPAMAQPFLASGYGNTIYGSFLNTDGTLEPPRVLAEQAKPSFFSQHPTLPIVYAVSETMRNDGAAPATVVAYRFELDFPKDGRITKLTEINRQPIQGDIPCHVTIDSQGRNLIVANYVNGSVVVFQLAADGTIGKETCNVVHAIPTGKTRSNAHCTVFSPDEKYLLVCDLGLDRVYIYDFHFDSGKITPSAQPFMDLPVGAGPRHLTFHPNGKWVFIINELNMTMTVAEWNGEKGTLVARNTEETIPRGLDRKGFSTAEVLVHPNGQFVYGSNRGHDSIVLMKLDVPSGKITRIDTFSTQGKTPRNFRIDPSGKYLLAENQGSDSVLLFSIDPADGRLNYTGNAITVLAPTCIRFLKTFR